MESLLLLWYFCSNVNSSMINHEKCVDIFWNVSLQTYFLFSFTNLFGKWLVNNIKPVWLYFAVSFSNITRFNLYNTLLHIKGSVIVSKLESIWIVRSSSSLSLITKIFFHGILLKAFCQNTIETMWKKAIHSLYWWLGCDLKSFIVCWEINILARAVAVNCPGRVLILFFQLWKYWRNVFKSQVKLVSSCDLYGARNAFRVWIPSLYDRTLQQSKKLFINSRKLPVSFASPSG